MNCSLPIGFSKMTKMYLQPISQILGKSYLEIEKFKKQQHRPAIDDCWGVDLNDFGMVFTISWLSYSLVYFLKVAMVSFMVVSPGTIRIRWGFSHLELLEVAEPTQSGCQWWLWVSFSVIIWDYLAFKEEKRRRRKCVQADGKEGWGGMGVAGPSPPSLGSSAKSRWSRIRTRGL